ncbi:MAG: hypothetical protein RLZZ192_894 [Pseudomonadota bacterium]|jgi:pilus assembly protein CpaB
MVSPRPYCNFFLNTNFYFQFHGDVMKKLIDRLFRPLAQRIFSVKQGDSDKPAPAQSKRHVLLDVAHRYWATIIGVVTALVAFFATQHYAETRVNAERDRLLPRGGMVEVLVAARDLSAGEQATPVTLAIRQVPREWLLPNTLTPQDFDLVADQSFIAGVSAGVPILLDHLRKVDRVQSGFQLEDGFRAVSIPVDEVSSIGGLIQPGDYVDLWGSPIPKASRAQGGVVSLSPVSTSNTQPARLIAENLRVLATGQNTIRREFSVGASGATASPSGYSSITLAVPAKVATLVLTGQFQGRLGVALRAAAEAVTGPKQKRSATRLKVSDKRPVEILVGGMEGAEE